jgi:pimeloyl-ACP methyl ester carboxylesterase
MTFAARALLLAREAGGLLPRSVRVLGASGSWNVLSLPGLRQLGEVTLDELVVTGMTLLAPIPRVDTPPGAYPPVADELCALGIAGAYVDPEPLQVTDIRRRRAGRLIFEQMIFEHEPQLPSSLRACGVTGPATAVCNLIRHPGGPRPWLVWVHGAGQGGLSDFAVMRAARLHHKLGYNIAMPIQPGHGIRRNTWPTYPETDPLTNVAGMMRAVSEVRAVIRWIAPQSTSIVLSGLSLGSAVAALAARVEEQVDAVAVYTPIRGLNTMIANHLHRWGSAADGVGAVLSSEVVARLTAVIDPLAVQPLAPAHRRLIVGAWHDQMAMRAPALDLHERWGGEIYWHDGGHVGHLFSGEVQAVTERFLRGVAEATAPGGLPDDRSPE